MSVSSGRCNNGYGAAKCVAFQQWPVTLVYCVHNLDDRVVVAVGSLHAPTNTLICRSIFLNTSIYERISYVHAGVTWEATINQQKLWWNRLLFSWLFHQSPFLFSFHLPGCSEALVQKWGLDLGSLQVNALTLAFLSVPFSHFNFDATVLQHLECQQLEKYRAVHDATHGFSRPSFSFGSLFWGFDWNWNHSGPITSKPFAFFFYAEILYLTC